MRVVFPCARYPQPALSLRHPWSVLQGLGDVRGGDLLLGSQIGDGAGES
jgi:hypothetical protein